MTQTTMPTSSQAMILRGNDGTERSRISVKSFSPFPTRSSPKTGNFQLPAKSPTAGNCELVKFDFSVSTSSGDRSVDGFQGMFAYDQKTKSYRWQICSVVPKATTEPQVNEMQGGDFINEDQFTQTDFDMDDKANISDSFINHQTSEHTQHFNTPVVSLTDNSRYIKPATELHGRPTPLSSLIIPPDTEAIDEVSYRRLEELGFRRRTTYTPGGALIRTKHGESPLKSPQKCSSTPNTLNNMATLTISNMDVSKVPKQKAIPFKIQGFQPKPFVSGDSMRKRVSPTKQKSLLQEVKDSVNWEKRIAPTTHFARQHPGYMPMSVCFSLRDGWKHSHAEVKELLEDQLQVKVKSLRYDPLSVRSPHEGMLDRWIVTFHIKDHCDLAVQKGLAVDGDIVVVKSWDDVLKEEYIPDSERDWDYPCGFRLQTEKHKHILRKFLQVH